MESQKEHIEQHSKSVTLSQLESWLKLITTYGATPVFAVWLWSSNNRISKLEDRLQDCYEKKVENNIGKNTSIRDNTLFAVIPTKQKLIQSDND